MKPKYNLNVTLTKEGKSVYEGIALMDAIFPLLPSEGKFSMTFRHENLRGFAKMVCLLATFGAKVGVKILTRADWHACATTGKDIPEDVKVEFSSKAAAVSFLYVSQIPCIVAGNWKTLPSDTEGALATFLKHIQENGINRLCTTGEGGKVIPLKKAGASNLSSVVETIMEAKKSIAGKIPAKKEDTSKQSPVARAKAAKSSPKGKTTRKVTKAEVVAKVKEQLDNPSATVEVANA